MTVPGTSAAGAPRLRVLVVDDEPTILQLIVMVLDHFLAADCDTAACAAEAMTRLKSGSYHALLTDVVMPGGSGTDLVDEARRLQPDLVCGLMTGYPVPEDRGILPEDVFLVTKPFRIEVLVEAIRNAVERERGAGGGVTSPPGA
jgi:CheY-like chemotaxis protein